MKSLHVVALAAACVVSSGVMSPAHAVASATPPIVIDLYGSFVENIGVGVTFSDYFGQQAALAIDFLPAAQWWPLGEFNSFGAHLTSGLNAPTTGQYTLTMGSDDASYLFIDGQLMLSLPGAHSYFTSQATLTLSSGYHSMSLQFYNSFCCGSQLTLGPGGLEYVNAVPEPGRLPLWLGGLLMTGLALRRAGSPAA